MHKQFALQGAVGKRVAHFPEIREVRDDAATAAAVSKLKAMTGNDSIQVDVKHKPPLTTKLRCVPILQTNDHVVLPDDSGAINSRLLVFPLRESFAGREDFTLAARLRREYAQIALWAAHGLRDLAKNGWRFQIPESSRAIVASLQAESAPIQSFVYECCEPDRGSAVDLDALYKLYEEHHEDQSLASEPLTKKAFENRLRAAESSVNILRRTSRSEPTHLGMTIQSTVLDSKTRRPRIVTGLRFRPEVLEELAMAT